MQDFNCFLSTFYRNILDSFDIYCRRGDDMLIDYALLTCSSYLLYKAVEKLDPAELLVNKLRKKGKHCLTLGYKRRLGMKCDIVVDMAKTPHCLISGISGSGKSMMAFNALKEKENLVLCNAFPTDFKGLKCRRIFKPDKIVEFLTDLVENPRYYEDGLWVCIDEGLVLTTSNKKASKAIMDLLAIGRHYNVWVIFLTQTSTKNEIPFKNLFGVRCCLRSVDPSSVSVVLGCNVDVKLNPRQFIVYHTDLEQGRTYDIK